MDLSPQTSRVAQLRNLALSSENTVGIILAVAVGAVAALGAIAFRWMIWGIQWVFFAGGAKALGFLGDYYVILLPALGGLLVGPIVHFFAREAKGHGVPEVMAAVAIRGGRIRPRVAVVKSLASSICIGSGGSVGREGPIVQIGSSLGSAIGQWLKFPDAWVRTLVACGAAGGIAATFNAPIAGAFFAQEVILRRFITPSFIFVVISSVAANIISHSFLGATPSFTVHEYAMISSWEILLYALLGIMAAFVAWGFARALYRSEDLFDSWKFPAYLKPVAGGLLVGLIGLFYPYIFGVGYGASYGSGGIIIESGGVDRALMGQLGIGLLLVLGFLKIAATSVTLGSGGSGGVFAPSLFMGAMFGGVFGKIVNLFLPASTAASGAYAMVGMAAVFAGAARAPITAIIMLFEMTRDYKIILPLMTATVISTLIARRLSRDSIYTAKLRRAGIELRRMEESDVMRSIRVSQAMTRNFPTVSPHTPVREVLRLMERQGHHGFPVVDEQGHFCGLVTLSDVNAATEKEGMDLGAMTVDAISIKSPIVAYPDQTLHEALLQLGAKDYGRIPVVDRNDPTRLLGLLRRHDIVRAYVNAVAKRSPRG